MQSELFYVATNGSDSWSGRLSEPREDGADGPFATIDRARAAIREMKAGSELQKPVEVVVRGGKYFLDKTVVLDPRDSGTQACPISYSAAPGEKVTISGGRIVTGWKPYKGRIWQAEIRGPKSGKRAFRQLFYNGKRQRRARWPSSILRTRCSADGPRWRGQAM